MTIHDKLVTTTIHLVFPVMDCGLRRVYYGNSGALNTMVTSELTGEVSMGVLLLFLVFWRRGRYIVPDQQGDKLQVT